MPPAPARKAADAPARPSSFAIEVPGTLLARARRGEHAAFEQIYRWFERPVYTLAMRLCGDRDEAADVLQETMMKVFDHIADFRGEASGSASPFWGWLRQIAVNEALMRLRKGRRRNDELELDGRDDLADPTPPPTAAADAAELQRALSRLPANTRSVLWLYHAEGYTHEEIAQLMERSVSFSKSQLARGTRRLRETLESGIQAPREVHHA